MSEFPDTHRFTYRDDPKNETFAAFQHELAEIVRPLLPQMREVVHHFDATTVAAGVINGVKISTNHFKCSQSKHESLTVILSEPADASTSVTLENNGDQIDFFPIVGVKKDILDLMVKAKAAFENPAAMKDGLQLTTARMSCMCG